MNRREAVDKLMLEYKASEVFRSFFAKVVDETCGESNIVTNAVMEIIRQRLRNMR